ncbi:hypothetical protein GCM10022419_128580 [Nonomuraea rosea]|uniref:N-acetylmuramoyl-L-alanine amidase n=1 Tax=Nonomuraea rosea TaxID=638574 RepID=A0ABP6ZZ48_9ACTN
MQLWLAAVLTAGALTAPAAPAAPDDAVGAGRQLDFAAAARDHRVPESVLLGVSYLESRWDANGGLPSTAGGYGPMHLVDAFPVEALWPGDALGDARGDDARPMTHLLTASPPPAALRTAMRKSAVRQETTLPEAARLAALTPDRLRSDPAANIRAGAALLASYQKHPSADPAAWYDAVARYSGATDPAAAHEFANEVFSVMREGAERRTDDGHLVRLDPVPNLPAAPLTGAGQATEQGLASGTDPDDQVAADEQAAADARTVTGEQAEATTQDDPDARAGAGPEIDTDDQTDTDGQTDEFGALPGEAALGTPYTGKTGQATPAGGQAECPATLACEWMPAAHKRFSKKGNKKTKGTKSVKAGKEAKDYGNHDRLSRARDVDYIIIHDTEGTYQGIPAMIRNPRYVSWHYTVRSRDGHVAQHVPTRDIAWHAGNWDVNTRSIGIEHEGYLAKGGTWYTEAMYRASAKLVRYLAGKHHIPLNRAHILGHDNVPGTTPGTVAGMHEDPGPYWDWAHYFDLMDRPIKGDKDGTSLMIRPSYDTNRPRFTGCVSTKPGQACPAHGAASVWLHTAPSETSSLITDSGKHPGKPSTYSVYDHSARASTGQRYAVAARQGDWTAIWYLGQKAWFHNPAANPAAVPAKGPTVTPLRPDTRVYGRAYPEKSAYRSASYQALIPLQYKIAPGQTYTVGDTITGSYYAAGAFSPARHVTTTGTTRYYQIQLGHRVMFVMAKDVRLTR